VSHQKQENDLTHRIASQVFALIPTLMQQIRRELRVAAQADLTVPQFRILARLDNKSTNHKDLADWIGVSLPAISRMITLLEKKNFVVRDRQTTDRRNIQLKLTEEGLHFFRDCRKTAQRSFARKHSALSHLEKERLNKALQILGALLVGPEEIYETSKRSVSSVISMGMRTRTK
jgi:DNA-binding MarR family transcriptional regulator